MFRKIALAALVVCAAIPSAVAQENWFSAYRPNNGQSYVDFLKAHHECSLEIDAGRTDRQNPRSHADSLLLERLHGDAGLHGHRPSL